jgi:hypothetical protein
LYTRTATSDPKERTQALPKQDTHAACHVRLESQVLITTTRATAPPTPTSWHEQGSIQLQDQRPTVGHATILRAALEMTPPGHPVPPSARTTPAAMIEHGIASARYRLGAKATFALSSQGPPVGPKRVNHYPTEVASREQRLLGTLFATH